MALKKVPQRTCVACRTVTGKRNLIRLVRRPNGEVVIDESGRLSGRGAYLCHNVECWQRNTVCIERALKTQLSPEAKNRLLLQRKDVLEEE